jgi:hypothetical protein
MSSMYERPRDQALNAMNRAQLAMRIAGGASLATGGVPGAALAANDVPHATGFDYGTVAPSSIYGSGAGPLTEAPASSGGARAHLSISIDTKGRVKTHLDHSADMEAHLDRGPGMTLAFG